MALDNLQGGNVNKEHDGEKLGKVYGALAAVISDFSVHGIAKERENVTQHFFFRGVDDVLNALSPLLAKHKLAIIPTYSNHRVEMREFGSEGKRKAVPCVIVEGTFQVLSTEDGSYVVSGPFVGEAMDQYDKATNKAMSAAYKYFAVQTFSIPVEGMDDPDGDADVKTDAKVDVAKWTKELQATSTREELLALFEEAKKTCEALNDIDGFAALKSVRDQHGKALAAKKHAAKQPVAEAA